MARTVDRLPKVRRGTCLGIRRARTVCEFVQANEDAGRRERVVATLDEVRRWPTLGLFNLAQEIAGNVHNGTESREGISPQHPPSAHFGPEVVMRRLEGPEFGRCLGQLFSSSQPRIELTSRSAVERRGSLRPDWRSITYLVVSRLRLVTWNDVAVSRPLQIEGSLDRG